MECRLSTLARLTWAQFHALFMETYVPQTLRDRKNEKFMDLNQGGMFVAATRLSFMICRDMLAIGDY